MNFLKITIFLTISALLLSRLNYADEGDKAAARVYAYLTIQDILSACTEAQYGLRQYPNSRALHEAYIKAVAKSGDEKTLWKAWEQYSAKFPDAYKNRDILEVMAWGTITQGTQSSSPLIRIIALLGAFFAQDAKGVGIICNDLKDPNSLIRSAAVKVGSHMRDAKLCDGVLDLFYNERNWKVRLETIAAVGKMKLEQAQPELLAIIGSDHTMADEKVAAIESLVELRDTVEHGEVARLAQSNRAGLRLLACELIENFELKDEKPTLALLMDDTHSEVRGASLHALGILRIELKQNQEIYQKAIRALQDPDTKTKVTAAWLLTLNDFDSGFRAFESLLNEQTEETRLLAAAALASTGKHALNLMTRGFRTTDNTYVKMNLALGLISQRHETEKACDALYQGLTQSRDRWMWKEEGDFKILSPSKVKHDPEVPNQPEMVNQTTRLEILNLLAMMKYPHTEKAIRQFLQQRNWGVTGIAAAMLLTEGDESAIAIVEDLLNDPDKKVKIQAALILAIWGGGDKAIEVLQEAYDQTSDREMKEHILEGLGNIGSTKSIPFLMDKLREQYQSLRIIAASALLECLYH
jgi:HEAT repeat protein